MDHRTREVLGRLARWWLLGGGIMVGAAAVAIVLLRAPISPTVAGEWSLTPDWARASHKTLSFHVKGATWENAGAPRFYLRRHGRTLLRPTTNYTRWSYIGLAPRDRPHRVVLDLVANPYSGYVRNADAGSVYLWPQRTELLLLDARSLLAVRPDGTLADRVESLWQESSRAVPLARLAGQHRPMAYLVMTPLAQYDRARRILRRAPPGPVLAPGIRWDSPAEPADVTAHVLQVRGNLRAWPVLATENAPLALAAVENQLAHKGLAIGERVFLVGGHASLPAPGINVPDWRALADRLQEIRR